jgi:hypothetical protein
MSEELKPLPCPMCSRDVYVYEGVGRYASYGIAHQSSKSKCHVTVVAPTKREAVAAWNRRAQPEPAAPALEQCQAPPIGWRCTRAAGHDGPCAAVECPGDAAFVENGMRWLRESSTDSAHEPEPPEGFKSWRDAAIHERTRRVQAERDAAPSVAPEPPTVSTQREKKT